MQAIVFIESRKTIEKIFDLFVYYFLFTFTTYFSNYLVKRCKNRINALVPDSTANLIAIYDCIESDYAA